MPNRSLIFSWIAILSLSAGCAEHAYVGSVEVVHGLSSYRPYGSSIIQENDHCFILAVDGRHVDAPNEDQGYIDAHTISYRQFEVPPGTHTLTVRYYRHVSRNVIETADVDSDVDTTTNQSGAHLGPANVSVNMAPKHIYIMQANVTSFTDSISAHWQPELIDKSTSQSAGKSVLQ